MTTIQEIINLADDIRNRAMSAQGLDQRQEVADLADLIGSLAIECKRLQAVENVPKKRVAYILISSDEGERLCVPAAETREYLERVYSRAILNKDVSIIRVEYDPGQRDD